MNRISCSVPSFLLITQAYVLENYLLIVGAKEEEEQKVSVRSRYLGDEGSKDLGEFIEAIKDEIAKKTIRKIEVEE